MPTPSEPDTTPEAGRADLVKLLQATRTPSVVSIGTFDGVHHGHRALVAAARRLARERGLSLTAVTFSPRPESLFGPATALPDICSLAERVRRLHDAGADQVVVVPFTREIAGIEYDDFASLLTTHLDMRALYIGADFALGRARLGTPERLRELGLEVHEQSLVPNAAGTAKASSTSIRRALAAGALLVHALEAA